MSKAFYEASLELQQETRKLGHAIAEALHLRQIVAWLDRKLTR